MGVTETAPTSLEDLVEAYDGAWSAHDLERILAFHAPDSTFVLRGCGETRTWNGIDACRECFDALLKAWPDAHLERTDLFVSDGDYIANHWFRRLGSAFPPGTVVNDALCIANHRFTGTLALDWTVGDRTYRPTSRQVEVELVDLVFCEGDRIMTRSSWIDGFALARQLESDAAS